MDGQTDTQSDITTINWFMSNSVTLCWKKTILSSHDRHAGRNDEDIISTIHTELTGWFEMLVRTRGILSLFFYHGSFSHSPAIVFEIFIWVELGELNIVFKFVQIYVGLWRKRETRITGIIQKKMRINQLVVGEGREETYPPPPGWNIGETKKKDKEKRKNILESRFDLIGSTLFT